MSDKQYTLLPCSTISAAVNADPIAVTAVLKHYEKYISSLAIKQFYDKQGRQHTGIDEDLRNRLEAKLITAILKFDMS